MRNLTLQQLQNGIEALQASMKAKADADAGLPMSSGDAGELGEYIVAEQLNGNLASRNQIGWDLLDLMGNKIQVKTRINTGSTKSPFEYNFSTDPFGDYEEIYYVTVMPNGDLETLHSFTREEIQKVYEMSSATNPKKWTPNVARIYRALGDDFFSL